MRSRARMPAAGAGAAGRAAARFASGLTGRLTARWRGSIRGRVLPAELRGQLALSRGELILAVGFGPDGSHALVATDRALCHPAAAGGWCRLGWESLASVGWDAAGGRLVITGLGGTAPPQTAVPLRDCGRLPELAGERITHTRLGCWPVTLDGRGRVLAEARRRPVTGELLWIVSSPDQLDLSDRHVRGQVGEAVTRLREELGIPRPASTGGGLPLPVIAAAPRQSG